MQETVVSAVTTILEIFESDNARISLSVAESWRDRMEQAEAGRRSRISIDESTIISRFSDFFFSCSLVLLYSTTSCSVT